MDMVIRVLADMALILILDMGIMAVRFGAGTIDLIGSLRPIVADAAPAAVFAHSVPTGQARNRTSIDPCTNFRLLL